MKKQLIELANDKGFKSPVIGKSVESEVSNKPFYFLWMCELQKWLIDECNVIVLVERLESQLEESENKYYPIIWRGEDTSGYYDDYDDALEQGLLEALRKYKG